MKIVKKRIEKKLPR